MQPPPNIGELRFFLGMVTYYRDMWPRRSHILAPLTELLGTKTYQWSDACQTAFQQLKAVIARETLLAYPDHSKTFYVETDASDYQLGGWIFQKETDESGQVIERDIAFYTRKLNGAQKNYSTIEKELLSIVEMFKAFRSALLGAKIEVYTNHKNLTYKMTQYTTQQVLRWRLIVEEYGPKFFYKPGSKNVVADALSRVPTTRSERESNEDKFLSAKDACLFTDNPELTECLLAPYRRRERM